MLGNENEPSASVTTSRLNPVSVWVIVTLAPGRTPPLGSLTVPVICAVACARTAVAVNSRSRLPADRQLRTRFMPLSPQRTPTKNSVKIGPAGEYSSTHHAPRTESRAIVAAEAVSIQCYRSHDRRQRPVRALADVRRALTDCVREEFS